MAIGLLMIGGGVAAGLFGSLLGLGGGVLIVPLLTLAFGLPLHQAVGVSLVCVIMTSSAAAGVYLERRVANLRLGMSLEVFTATGALLGGSLAFIIDERLLDGLFAALLAYVAATMLLRGGAAADAAETGDVIEPESAGTADVVGTTATTTIAASTPTVSGVSAALPATRHAADDRLSGDGYQLRNLRLGIVGSAGAGVASALFGIGGGIIKVPLMHLVMGVPLRVATATSNLMIGITAAASAAIYLFHGQIDPYVAGPAGIGVFIGATVGSRVAHRVDVGFLRVLFVVVLAYTAIQMLVKALG